jgi:hypothetical protein
MFAIYEDATLDTLFSAEDSFTNPDDETDLNGDDGDNAVKKMYCAAVQTTLNGGINDVVTSVVITAAVFKWTDCPVIKIDDELMYVTAGLSPAGTTLTVTRGWNNTTAAAHLSGARVYMAYNGLNVTVSCRDNEQVITGDESSRVTYCADSGGSPDGSYAASLNMGSIAYDSSVTFHRKVTIPASTDAASEQDLIHDVEAKLVPLDS